MPRHDRVLEFLEIFSNETFLRLSQEMMHSQINRAIRSAISDRVIPEIQNNMGSLSSGAEGHFWVKDKFNKERF